VSPDLDEVLASLKRDDWELLIAGVPTPVPGWVDWLIWLGQWMRAQASLQGRRAVVVRVPSRGLAATFTAVGTALASARLHDDSLDWEGLRSLAPGTKVFWRESASGKSVRRSGVVVGLRQIQGADFMEVDLEPQNKKALRGTRLFAKSAALSYGITLGSVSAAANERLSCAARFIAAAVNDSSQGWIRSPGVECSVITERSSFLADLADLEIRVGGKVRAPCLDVLAIAESVGVAHGKTLVVSARTDELEECGHVTILDGATAALRLSETIARSVVVLLDQAEYDEEIEQLFQTFLGYPVDSHIHPPVGGVKAPPASVESFTFGLPLQAKSSAL
jgi:hypothetical protein